MLLQGPVMSQHGGVFFVQQRRAGYRPKKKSRTAAVRVGMLATASAKNQFWLFSSMRVVFLLRKTSSMVDCSFIRANLRQTA
jgi:hypothetical protein